MADVQAGIAAVLKKYSKQILTDWMKQLSDELQTDGRISESEISNQAREFLNLLQSAFAINGIEDVESASWTPLREFLDGISRSRAQQGFSSDETATFVFSFKKPLFDSLRQELAHNPQALAGEIWNATELLDHLGLHTIKTFQKAREGLISRQQEEMLELSTPVVKLWEGILALPIIGTLDSARTQIVMESLLQKIVDTGSEIAIIDITGVPMVDTMTAQHLLKTAAALRMMGADCIISGIRPQIAQTIVHLGVDLQGVTTKATLADALALALKRSGFLVSRNKA
ncbi:MAG: STAS domain-containing protein [Deltaproteobacteria bacterium]|nr:STAS domain-containing protein [Deltaproteobacteria bacterium]